MRQSFTMGVGTIFFHANFQKMKKAQLIPFVVIAGICSVAGCTQAGSNTTVVDLSEPMVIELRHVRNDSVPFCEFYTSSSGSHRPLPDKQGLAFVPTEIREIETRDYLLHFNTNTPFFSRKNDVIFYLFGKDNANNPVICFDTNNDGLFENERFYNVNTTMPFIKISNLKYYISDTSFAFRTIYLMPKKRSRDTLVYVHNKDVFFSRLPTYMYDTINIDNHHYKFALMSMSEELYFHPDRSVLAIIPQDSSFPKCTDNLVFYRRKDTIFLNNRRLVFDSVSADGHRVFFLSLKNPDNYGVEVNHKAPPVKGENILTGKSYNLRTGQYTLIDFWGTWCGPCVQSIPDLKKINEIYKSKGLQIVSIASDDSKKVVQQFLNKNGITWINLFENRNQSNIVRQYAVHSYPTYILIDPSGKIIARKVGIPGLEEIKQMLKEQIR